MQDDSTHNFTKKNTFLNSFITAFVVYCLAFGPMVYVCILADNRLELAGDSIFFTPLYIFYPHFFVAENFEIYGNYMNWWIELGGGLDLHL